MSINYGALLSAMQKERSDVAYAVYGGVGFEK